MNNFDVKKKLGLLETALMSGASEWAYDEDNGILTAFYKPETVYGLECSRYWVSENGNGELWIYAHDQWKDGFVMTDVAQCFQL